ncbi:hypothetical protein PV_037 (endogenous virus) [Gutovirus Vc1]|uniref:Uncharacterized protein n=1 Tax=Vibrio phage Vc1 TaxID=1480731 RepID=X2KT48_9CAUD|nr:hypothetical protein HOQ97_gp37 [Vibrio phage Vc1]AHN84688.1 hypothetical protein PV_037 [Vibrio phage Vc1]
MPLVFGIIVLALVLLGGAGWVMNIIEIAQNFDVMSTGEAIIRIAGVPLAFIGAIMGWC